MKYLFLILLVAGCAAQSWEYPMIEYQVDTDAVFRDVTCEVNYAIDQVRSNIDPELEAKYTVNVVTQERVTRGCGEGAAACTYLYNVVVHYDTPEYICQQVMHEYGHAVSMMKYGDWDYNESKFGDYYTHTLVTACAAMTASGLCSGTEGLPN